MTDAAKTDTALVLTGAPLFDGTGRDLHDAAVVVVGDRIERVVGPGELQSGSGDAGREAIDLDGCTLLPGLIDAHTHMGIVDLGFQGMPPAVQAAHLFANAEECLHSGHTTAREVAGADGGLRQAIDAGLVPGPHLLPSGPLLSQTGGHGDHGRSPFDALHHHSRRVGPALAGVPGLITPFAVADGAEEVRIAARDAFRRGATQLKVCVSGGVVSFTDDLTDAQYTIEELRAAVDEATARDTYVTAHAHNVAGIRNGLEAGIACFEHGTFLDESTAAAMAAADAALVPTLAVIAGVDEHWEAWGIPEEVLPRFDGVLEAMQASIRIAMAAGVTIGSGSDILGPGQHGRGVEVELKAEMMGAASALESATRVNAEILRIADQAGTVEPGKRADLVAVRGNPLEDPSLLADADNVVLVIKSGEVVKDVR